MEASKALELSRNLQQTSRDRRVSLNIYLSAEAIDPVAIAVLTFSLSTPRLITRFRLPIWIFAFCMLKQAYQRLQFSYGVYPVEMAAEPYDWGEFTRNFLRKHGFNKKLALLTQGYVASAEEVTNAIKIIELSDIASFCENSPLSLNEETHDRCNWINKEGKPVPRRSGEKGVTLICPRSILFFGTAEISTSYFLFDMPGGR
jgi:hypothetical protein